MVDAGLRWPHVMFTVSLLGMLLKQLRLLGESIGIFEIVGLACALYFITSGRGRPSASDVFATKLMMFLAAMFGFGAVVSAIFFPLHVSPRELIATAYVTVLMLGWICMMPEDVPRKLEFLRNVIAGYVGAISMIGLLTFGKLKTVWYFDVYLGRFLGLSDNPNQLASICVVGVVLTALLRTMERPLRRRDIWALLALCLGGALTQSVALVGGLIGSAMIAAAFHFSSDAPQWARKLFRLSILASVIAVVLVLMLFGDRILEASQYLYSGGTGKGVVRVRYWMNALSLIPYSPIVGFGPGAHVQIEGTEQLQEAHNVFIDILMSGGIAALLPFVAALAFLFVTAVKQKRPLILFAVLALTVFSMFQTVLRYALFWIAIHAAVYAALMPQVKRAAPATRRNGGDTVPSGNAA